MQIIKNANTLIKNNKRKKAQTELEQITQTAHSRESWLFGIVGVTFFIGVIVTGILLSTILPDTTDTCSINVHRCDTTLVKAESEIQINCTAFYQNESDVDEDRLEDCFHNYIIRESIGTETKAVALVISFTMGCPLVFLALGRHYILNQIKEKLMQLYYNQENPFKDGDYAKYTLISIVCYVISFILYSLSIWRLFEADYVLMSVLAILVGFISVLGSFSYAFYVQQYTLHAIELQKIENKKAEDEFKEQQMQKQLAAVNNSQNQMFNGSASKYVIPNNQQNTNNKFQSPNSNFQSKFNQPQQQNNNNYRSNNYNNNQGGDDEDDDDEINI